MRRKMYLRPAIGFFSEGKGKKRKIRPITAPTRKWKRAIIDLKLVPKAPNKWDYKKGKPPITVAEVNVKRLAENGVAVYVDGEGNIIAYDVLGQSGEWWKIPKLGSTKLRDEKIYTRRSIRHPAKMNPLWAQRMIQGRPRRCSTCYRFVN